MILSSARKPVTIRMKIEADDRSVMGLEDEFFLRGLGIDDQNEPAGKSNPQHLAIATRGEASGVLGVHDGG